MDLSLAVSQTLATSRHQGTSLVLFRLPQHQTRWMGGDESADMMENQKLHPQRVYITALQRIVTLRARNTWLSQQVPGLAPPPLLGSCVLV